MRLFSYILLVFLIYLAKGQEDFEEWRKKFKDIEFQDENEEAKARKNFEENSKFIDQMNARPDRTFELAKNEFAYIKFDDFKNKYLGVNLPDEKEKRGNRFSNSLGSKFVQPDGSIGDYTAATVPSALDYTNDYMLPVKNQGQCGSCYIFAVVATFESRMKSFNSSFSTQLSEQNLLDCDRVDSGCDGGWPFDTINWFIGRGGNAIASSVDYPYTAQKKGCKNRVKKIPMGLHSAVQENLNGNEEALKLVVANVGPVTIAIEATSAFQLYSSGIFHDPSANNNCTSVNHAVTITGYGSENGVDYWMVKNSWGSGWGEKGYIKMKRNSNNNSNLGCWATYGR